MYSQCPECQTHFRVTAEVLRVAQGTVRCGRCGSAFNALSRLSDSLAEAMSSPPSTPAEMASAASITRNGHSGTPEVESHPSEFHFSAEDIERVFVDSRDWQRQFGAERHGAPGFDAPAAESSEYSADDARTNDAEDDASNGPFVEVDEAEQFEDITLEGERIVIEGLPGFLLDSSGHELVDAELVEARARLLPNLAPAAPVAAADEPKPGSDLDSTDRFEVLTHVPDSAYPEIEDDGADESTDDAAPSPLCDVRSVAGVTPASAELPGGVSVAAAAETTGILADDDIQGEAVTGRGSAWSWGLGGLLLALVLVAQLTHFYRQDLVRDPNIGPVLRSVYDRLGLPLAPDWDLTAYQLRQWGATDTAPAAGRMNVRASIKNRAAHAQPLPLLRLELEDRFGGTVGRRDFEPKEYLKDPAQASRLLAAGAVTEAELALADTTQEAVGYRLDVCMRDVTGEIRCAQGNGR